MSNHIPYQSRTPTGTEAQKPSKTACPPSCEYAHIKAYRRPGGAVVTISRGDGRTHRHVVSLRRYRKLWDALFTRSFGKASGWFGMQGLDIYLWR